VIAESMMQMATLRTPIICVVIGEGGSGGALGIGLGDRVAVLEYAYYSVISPEGCAGILWKSHDFAPQAARALKITSRHLHELGVMRTATTTRWRRGSRCISSSRSASSSECPSTKC
jgi:acetyl-CoA carboxylase carboxyl transferase subunit alpha